MRKFATLLIGGLVLAGAAQVRAGVSVDVRIGSPPPPPVVYTPGVEQVWVPATTQTVVQNVWHEPVTQDQVTQTWLPDQYELRDVPSVDPYGRPCTVKQNVLVAPGHWQDVHNPVVVRAGYYGPEAQTVVVTPGHWETVQRPVYVRGYCEPGPVIYGRPGPWRDYHDYGRHDFDHRDYRGDHYRR